MNSRPLRGWMVLFILVTGLSAALLASRNVWPEALLPWRDWLSAKAAPPGGRGESLPTDVGVHVVQRPPAPADAAKQEEDVEEASFAALGYEFPADEAGKLLRERLTPPRKVQVAAFPFVDKPGQPRRLVAEDLTHHLKRAAAQPAAGSLILPDERRSIVRAAPALDNPPLAFELDPSRPSRPTWPGPQLAYVPGPDAQRVSALALLGQPVIERPTLQDDPTSDAARRALLTAVPLTPPVLPPLLRLTIPDPHEAQRVVHLANPPADTDLAAQHYQRPETPTLPVAKGK